MISADVTIRESELPVAVITLSERMDVLSTAVMNGGHTVTQTMMIMEVPPMYDDGDPLDHIQRIRGSLGLPDDTVGFMTAASVKDVISYAETEFEGILALAVVTSGLTNIVTAGEVIEDIDERIRSERKKRAGTINIIGISSVPLTEEAKIESIMTMTEAKTASLNAFGYTETGTTSDAIAIASPVSGDRRKHCGTGTDAGISLARSVRKAVGDAVIKRNDQKKMGTFMDQLSGIGVTEQKIVEAAFLLYVRNPEWDDGDLERMFRRKLDVYCKDINVSSLIQAAIELDRLGKMDCICAMPRGMFAADPIHLIADEMMGLQLAQYIAGVRGIFEFNRFDRHKPGIIGKLGPFMDDIICGLAGGIMSSIYTELLEEGD